MNLTLNHTRHDGPSPEHYVNGLKSLILFLTMSHKLQTPPPSPIEVLII